MNAVTYKEVFPLVKENKMWMGYRSLNRDMYFDVTQTYQQWLVDNKKEGSAYKIVGGNIMGRLANACWFTNIEHGKRYEKMILDTMINNLRFNKSLKKKLAKYGDENHFPKYDNYDAIEIPIIKCIPSDYSETMGVPITFLDKFSPEQFEIIGELISGASNKYDFAKPTINGKKVYARILIKHKDSI